MYISRNHSFYSFFCLKEKHQTLWMMKINNDND